MPIYEYRCQTCTTVYEERRSFSQSDEPSFCPECESPQVQRLISSFFAFSAGGNGASLSLGGGCACSAGGTCACARN